MKKNKSIPVFEKKDFNESDVDFKESNELLKKRETIKVNFNNIYEYAFPIIENKVTELKEDFGKTIEVNLGKYFIDNMTTRFCNHFLTESKYSKYSGETISSIIVKYCLESYFENYIGLIILMKYYQRGYLNYYKDIHTLKDYYANQKPISEKDILIEKIRTAKKTLINKNKRPDNLLEVSKLLGIKRSTLNDRLKKYGIDFKTI